MTITNTLPALDNSTTLTTAVELTDAFASVIWGDTTSQGANNPGGTMLGVIQAGAGFNSFNGAVQLTSAQRNSGSPMPGKPGTGPVNRGGIAVWIPLRHENDVQGTVLSPANILVTMNMEVPKPKTIGYSDIPALDLLDTFKKAILVILGDGDEASQAARLVAWTSGQYTDLTVLKG